MSGQNPQLSGQIFALPVMLTDHMHWLGTATKHRDTIPLWLAVVMETPN